MTRARFQTFASDQSLTGWIKELNPASGRWLDKHCIFAAWAGLLLALLTPPHGNGFTVCWLKSSTGIPCPGCGLTRSLSCGMRGMFTESWHYHPMGFLVLALFAIIAATSVVPAIHNYLNSFIDSKARLFNILYLGFVVTFVLFGLVRALVAFGHWLP